MATPPIQSLERALDILEELSKSDTGMRVNELCACLGLNKSTVSRMLATLASRGYVEKRNTGEYRLGLRIVELSSDRLSSVQLKTEALPYMEDLRNRVGLTVHLGMMVDMEVVYLEKLGAFSNIRMYSQIGKRVYAHCTGLGNAMMAYMDESAVLKILREKGMPRLTEKTVTSEEGVLKKLETVRRNGYAYDEEENEKGVHCVAAPIFDYRGNVIAAISTTGFFETITAEQVEALAQAVMDCAKKISKAMGYITS